MLKNNYLFYSDFLKKRNTFDKVIMIAKTKKSYLIGPLIDDNLYKNSFYKRIKSNSIYSSRIYKRMCFFKANSLINENIAKLNSNQVIEIYKNGEVVYHSILRVPGEDNEKK